ncbi:hypothetical protein FACS189479_00790 [Spirochaetia bacterium]|nr:hypothetical protein FACS189479_00790 [Spirochaetia bacterium]
MEHDGAQDLHIVGPFPQAAPGRLAGQGKGFGQKGVQTFPILVPLPELRGLFREFLRGEGKGPGLFFIYAMQYREKPL